MAGSIWETGRDWRKDAQKIVKPSKSIGFSPKRSGAPLLCPSFCEDELWLSDVLVNRGICYGVGISWSINLKAAFHGTQIAACQMREQGKGVVINMSSVNAILNIPALLAYNVRKGGLNQLTRNTAICLAPFGIRVCGIGPGTVLTELTPNAVWTDDAARRAILSRTVAVD